MKLRFVTNRQCPFAHKAWIALEESQRPFEMEEISLYGPNGKPDWFWKLNPAGTVPVLVAGGQVLPDSDDILDYLDTESGLGKEWRTVVNDMLPAAKQAVLSRNERALQECLMPLEETFDAETTYLTGDDLSIADCHAFPFLWRIDNEFGLPPKLEQWVQTMKERPAVAKTCVKSYWWWW